MKNFLLKVFGVDSGLDVLGNRIGTNDLPHV